MVVFTIRIKVRPEKRRELKQTLRGFPAPTGNGKGCLGHHFYEDLEDKDSFILVEEWESRAKLNDFLRSDRFGVLLGAMDLLGESPRIRFTEITDQGGMEVIEAARGTS